MEFVAQLACVTWDSWAADWGLKRDGWSTELSTCQTGV